MINKAPSSLFMLSFGLLNDILGILIDYDATLWWKRVKEFPVGTSFFLILFMQLTMENLSSG